MKKNKINIMIIGDGEVGKTSILSKFDNQNLQLKLKLSNLTI